METKTHLSHDDYTVGWICALPLEVAAATLMLDEIHPQLLPPPTDQNDYHFGRVGKHNVVITSLPAGAYGSISAALVAVQLLSSFPAIRFNLMVGIGGGIPSETMDIRLGDVVVSKPTDTFGGVIQYDLGKYTEIGQIERTGMLHRPPRALLTALSILQAQHLTDGSRIGEIIANLQTIPRGIKKFARPTQEDCLFQADYRHGQDATCMSCDRSKLCLRPARESKEPVIYYGLIGSTNAVVRDGKTRDHLAKDLGICCVDMELAGLMNDFPGLVIRGISDYADSHKSKEWQPYAALVAAAYAKELLAVVPGDQVDSTPTARLTLAGAEEVRQPKLTRKDAVIVVVGPTGVGKSHFIRAATGDSSIKVGATLESVTDRLHAYRTKINDRSVVLVDTIGFDDTYRSDTDVLREIATWLADAHVEEVDLAGVLYMHDIRSPRFTGSAAKNMRMFKKLVGEAALGSVKLVTNRWDEVNSEQGESRLKELTQNHNFWGSMIERGSTVERFSGTAEDAQRILKSVLDKNHRTTLNIQRELVDRQLDLSETETGQILIEQIKNLQKDHRQQIARLQNEMKEALESKDAQIYEMMAQKQAELEGRLNDYKTQISELKRDRGTIEELRRGQVEEIKRLQDSFGDRLGFLEEQNSAPPPAYDEVPGAVGTLPDIGNITSEPTSPMSYKFWALLRLIREVVQRLLRPRPRTGYRRLEWRCSCGEILYGDFQEKIPGSIDELVASLREHSGRESQNGASTSRQPSSKVNTRLPSLLMGWSMPRDGGNSGRNDPHDPETPVAAGGPSTSNTRTRETLQLCIETGKFALELSELSLTQPHSDGQLFERIREKYEQARHSILPMRFRFSKPGKAIFIKFRVGKRPLISPIAGSVEMPSIPSEAEVTSGEYRYAPCPIDEPPMDYRTFLHHFYAPASDHPDTMWGTRLPWKIGPGLGPMTQGWGIQLEEQPDWPLFTAYMFLLLLISGLVAGIYSWKTGDPQTGVAIGSWLTATQAMGITALFFWRE